MLHNRSRAVGSVLALTVTLTLLMGHKAARAETPIRPTPPEAKSAKTGAGAKGIDFGAVRPVPGNVWAVIVGVDYVKSDKKAHIPPLNYSVSDANLVRTALGLDETHLRFLTSDRDHCLTREEVITALKDMTKKAKAGDTVWFYFSGHGLVVKEGSYLVPEDFRWEDPTTCISVTEIRSILQDTQATARVVVLDACHSGATRDIQSTEWRPDFSPVSGTITMAACQPNQVAYEFPVLGSGHGGGVFTYYLVCGLYGGAENAQKKDGWVHLGDLRYWVGQQVKEECLRRGLHAPQEPVFLLPDGSNDARVAQVNPEKLKQMREQNMPSPAPLNVQRPIGPGLIVSVEGDDRTTAGTVESKLNNFFVRAARQGSDGAAEYAVLSSVAAEPYITLLHNPNDPESKAKANRLAQCLLLRVSLSTNRRNRTSVGTVAVSLTANAQLLDRDGRVLDQNSLESLSCAGFNEASALSKAADDLIPKLSEYFSGEVKKQLTGK